MMSVVRHYWVSRLADCVKPWASGQVWPFAPFSKFWASGLLSKCNPLYGIQHGEVRVWGRV